MASIGDRFFAEYISNVNEGVLIEYLSRCLSDYIAYSSDMKREQLVFSMSLLAIKFHIKLEGVDDLLEKFDKMEAINKFNSFITKN